MAKYLINVQDEDLITDGGTNYVNAGNKYIELESINVPTKKKKMTKKKTKKKKGWTAPKSKYRSLSDIW